jgi:hypothetical protein
MKYPAFFNMEGIMKKVFLVLLALVSTYSYGLDDSMSPANLAKGRAKTIELTKRQILDRLSDPDSTTFKDVHTDKIGSYVCGKFNAKNKMGGYVGYKRFYSIGGDESFLRIEGTDGIFIEATWDKCMKTN